VKEKENIPPIEPKSSPQRNDYLAQKVYKSDAIYSIDVIM